MFFVFYGLVVGGALVLKQVEVAHVAREVARYASVHGGQYAKSNPVVDDAKLLTVAQGKGFTLDPAQLQLSVTMTVIAPGSTSATNTETVDWDNTTENQNRSPYSVWTDLTATPPSNVEVLNTVTATVTYPWSPGLLGLGTINLTSTAVIPMSQ
jgi:hypothetical protein